MRASWERERRLVKPRMPIAHWLELMRATWTPGTRRRASGMLVAPERLMSSAVMTWMAAGGRNCGSSVLDTEVTLVCASSSRLMDVRSGRSTAAWDVEGPRRAGDPSPPTRRSRLIKSLIPLLTVSVPLISNMLFYFLRLRQPRSCKRYPMIQVLPDALMHRELQ